jgi:hypothetical protein
MYDFGPGGAIECGGEAAVDSARLMEELATDVGDLEIGDFEVRLKVLLEILYQTIFF